MDSQHKRALIVDDEHSVRAVLELALAEEGWQVTAVSTAAAALESMVKGSYDVYFVDKNLPDCHGLKLIAQLRAQDPQGAIFIMSGYRTKQSLTEAVRLGVTEFLEKPFDDIFNILNKAEVAAAQSRQRRAR